MPCHLSPWVQFLFFFFTHCLPSLLIFSFSTSSESKYEAMGNCSSFLWGLVQYSTFHRDGSLALPRVGLDCTAVRRIAVIGAKLWWVRTQSLLWHGSSLRTYNPESNWDTVIPRCYFLTCENVHRHWRMPAEQLRGLLSHACGQPHTWHDPENCSG